MPEREPARQGPALAGRRRKPRFVIFGFFRYFRPKTVYNHVVLSSLCILTHCAGMLFPSTAGLPATGIGGLPYALAVTMRLKKNLTADELFNHKERKEHRGKAGCFFPRITRITRMI